MDAERENQNVLSVISHGDGQLVVNLLQCHTVFLRSFHTACHRHGEHPRGRVPHRQRKSHVILPDFMLRS